MLRFFGNDHRRLYAAAAIIALIVIAGFSLSVPHTRDLKVEKAAAVATSTPAVALHDSYKKGVHTLSGTITAPDACAAVTASATLEGNASSTARIVLSLSLPEDTGICLELPSAISFQTKVTAPSGVPITVLVNGSVASSTPS